MELVPQWDRLVEVVLARATHAQSLLHGPGHWRCVAWAGLQLFKAVPSADPVVVLLFGLFHDAMRVNDGSDPAHGRRAAWLARDLAGSGELSVTPARLGVLVRACELHADGLTTADPTVGVCWDADRLNLWRVGVRPSPRLLCTAAAKDEARIRWASAMEGQGLSWGTIYGEYCAAAG